MKRKKVLVLIGALLLVVVAIVVGVYFTQKTDKKTVIEKSADEYIKDENTRLNKLADSVDSLKELKAINDKDQGQVGVLIITSGKKNEKLLNEIIEYLLKRNDSVGIAAAQVCYERSKTDQERSRCKERADEIAHKMGILKEGEKYPDTYFDSKSKEQG